MSDPGPAEWGPQCDPWLVRIGSLVMRSDDADALIAILGSLPWWRRFWFWLSGQPPKAWREYMGEEMNEGTLPDDPDTTARLECARRVGRAALEPEFRTAVPQGTVVAMVPEDTLERLMALLADSPDDGALIHVALAGPGEDDVLVARVQVMYMTPDAP
jgi:uncharacterized protein (DUF2126 family)